MAKVRNVSGEGHHAGWLDRWVEPDEVIEVPDEDLDAYLLNPAYELVEQAKNKKTAARGQED